MNKCDDCKSNCLNCIDNLSCLECKENYYLEKFNECVKECTVPLVIDYENGLCVED